MALEELDYDYNLHNPAAQAADAALLVKFYMSPLKDEEKSLEEGRPIFKDTEMVEIRVRGDRNNVVMRPVFDEDRRRFRRIYNDWKEGKSQEATGTPLGEWPVVSASFVEEMKYLGFRTVEDIANASESAKSKVPGLTSISEKAKRYIEFAKDQAPIAASAQEIEDLKSQVSAKDAQLADMSRRMAALEATLARQPDEKAGGTAAKRS